MLLAAIYLDEYVNILESDESLQEDSRVFAAAASNGHSSTVHGVCAQCQHQQKGEYKLGHAAEYELSSREMLCLWSIRTFSQS